MIAARKKDAAGDVQVAEGAASEIKAVDPEQAAA
jgi:hypothetical protein